MLKNLSDSSSDADGGNDVVRVVEDRCGNADDARFVFLVVNCVTAFPDARQLLGEAHPVCNSVRSSSL